MAVTLLLRYRGVFLLSQELPEGAEAVVLVLVVESTHPLKTVHIDHRFHRAETSLLLAIVYASPECSQNPRTCSKTMTLLMCLEQFLTLFPNNLFLGPLAVLSYPRCLIFRWLEVARTSSRSPMVNWTEERKLIQWCRNSNNVLLTAHGTSCAVIVVV